MSRLDGRVAVISGASGGIGQAAAQAMASQGAAVVIADIQDELGETAAHALGRAGARAAYVHVDVTSEDDVAMMVETAVSQFGRIDCAVNNAGIEGTQAPAAEQTPADWQRVLDVNLGGVWRCMRAQIPVRLATGGGSIVTAPPWQGWSASRGSHPTSRASTASSASPKPPRLTMRPLEFASTRSVRGSSARR